ncbi:PREDICTED: protein UPSTREAM OF FLC-like isoform X2 [Ipomoea nil]|uniref:protein UPSTREAM OF FLC-like isoform X2 n=1 Tax=Ipomoea nil TaxID=35883 RepID=UPI000900988F|nr:PREDICTED: protein UPSTREAM OF FLC-like isoform X2 [Ipomoea nil]
MAAAGTSRWMELHMAKKWRDKDISPERTKVWTQPPERRVAVVYYLSLNGKLQHPHFMELRLSSPRDVLDRLNSLRGEGMASLYSWSAKRKYKNGFVWQDLEENDFIYPAHGHEYILKGSELIITHSSSQETPALTAAGEDREFPPLPPPRHNVHAVEEDKESGRSGSSEPSNGEISTPPAGSSPETLAALMKADRRRVILMNEARKAAAYYDPSAARPRTASVVMQILSCGSVAAREHAPPCKAKTHAFSLISHHKMATLLPCGTRRNNPPDVAENAVMELPLITSVYTSL